LNKPPQRPFPALYREGALSPSNTWNNGKTMSRRAFSRRPALLIRQNPTLTGIGIPHHTRGFTLGHGGFLCTPWQFVKKNHDMPSSVDKRPRNALSNAPV
jgi:hypothetical protein